MRRISIDGAVTYGLRQVANAAEQGAVETLVIEASLLRTEEGESEWVAVADEVEGSGGRVIQASTDHDSGQQLHGMGGAIAILRWKLD